MPVRATAQQASDKWLQGMQGASARMTAGAMAVTQAPGAKAAAAADKWLAKVTAAKPKFQANVGAVTLQQWQTSFTQIGVPRVASGAQAKQPKFTNFMSQFIPHLQAGVAKVDAMPSATLQDGINRAIAMIQHNAQFKRSSAGS